MDGPSALEALKLLAENPAYKVATIKRKISVCRAFLQSFDEKLAYSVSKVWKIKFRSPIRLPKAVPRIKLSAILRSARRDLVESVDSDGTTHLALSVMAATGLRVSELCATRLPDVNPQTGEIKVFGEGSKE